MKFELLEVAGTHIFSMKAMTLVLFFIFAIIVVGYLVGKISIKKNQCDDPKYRKQHTADFGAQDIEVRRSVCRIGLPLLCQRPEPFRFQENQDAANDKCNTAERVPPWHNIDLPTKSNGLCGKQADAR